MVATNDADGDLASLSVELVFMGAPEPFEKGIISLLGDSVYHIDPYF